MHDDIPKLRAMTTTMPGRPDGRSTKEQILPRRHVQDAHRAHDPPRIAPNPILPRVHVVAIHVVKRFSDPIEPPLERRIDMHLNNPLEVIRLECVSTHRA